MTADTAYIMDGGLTAARLLHLLGNWDDALASLPEGVTDEGVTVTAALRAEILTDRFFWRLDRAGQARDAVAYLAPKDPGLAGFLGARLAYTRVLFGLDPEPDDATRAREGFTAAMTDDRLRGWAVFWLGVLADNVDADAAGRAYEQALAAAREGGDVLLESYVVRHQGAHLLERDRNAGVTLLRRSYHLRAALGARPQTAAAAVTLAGELPAGPEADELRSAAALTARDLGLTWLLRAL